MEKFVLKPARLRGVRLAPISEEPVMELDWPQLVETLGAQKRRAELLVLRRLTPGDFVGIRIREDGPSTFYVSNRDRSGRVGWLLDKQPGLFNKLVCLYRVEVAQYSGSFAEGAST